MKPVSETERVISKSHIARISPVCEQPALQT
jgi:hypothetical protein